MMVILICFYMLIVGYGPWWKHYIGFWERRNEPHVLFLTYEDLQKVHVRFILFNHQNYS